MGLTSDPGTAAWRNRLHLTFWRHLDASSLPCACTCSRIVVLHLAQPQVSSMDPPTGHTWQHICV